MKTNKKGFTLLELLVVILIIGILAGIALPQYKMAVAKSRYSTMMDLAKSIAYAEDRYFLINSAYTSNIDKLDIDIPKGYSKLDSAQYCYDWGGCRIDGQAVRCINFSIGSHVTIYLKNGSAFQNVRGFMFCDSGTFNQNDFPNRICKNITQRNTSVPGHGVLICKYTSGGNSYLFGSY